MDNLAEKSCFSQKYITFCLDFKQTRVKTRNKIHVQIKVIKNDLFYYWAHILMKDVVLEASWDFQHPLSNYSSFPFKSHFDTQGLFIKKQKQQNVKKKKKSFSEYMTLRLFGPRLFKCKSSMKHTSGKVNK